MRSKARRAGRGFTLVEVLVAFTILGLTLAALFQAFGGGLRGVAIARDYLAASAEARSIVQRVGVDIPVRPGALSGDLSDGNRWEVSIEPDGAVRLGLRYVAGLRRETADRIAGVDARGDQPPSRGGAMRPSDVVACPKCGCDDPSMIDRPLTS